MTTTRAEVLRSFATGSGATIDKLGILSSEQLHSFQMTTSYDLLALIRLVLDNYETSNLSAVKNALGLSMTGDTLEERRARYLSMQGLSPSKLRTLIRHEISGYEELVKLMDFAVKVRST